MHFRYHANMDSDCGEKPFRYEVRWDSYQISYRNLAWEIFSNTTTDINSYRSPYRCFSFAVTLLGLESLFNYTRTPAATQAWRVLPKRKSHHGHSPNHKASKSPATMTKLPSTWRGHLHGDHPLWPCLSITTSCDESRFAIYHVRCVVECKTLWWCDDGPIGGTSFLWWVSWPSSIGDRSFSEGLEFMHSFWDLGLLAIGIWAGPLTEHTSYLLIHRLLTSSPHGKDADMILATL
jgi:hypothetical protein